VGAKVGERYVYSPLVRIVTLSVRRVQDEERRGASEKAFPAFPWVFAFSVVHTDVCLRSPYLLESRK
jgi:hypothetical protein